jgi:hypothetical protein
MLFDTPIAAVLTNQPQQPPLPPANCVTVGDPFNVLAIPVTFKVEDPILVII